MPDAESSAARGLNRTGAAAGEAVVVRSVPQPGVAGAGSGAGAGACSEWSFVERRAAAHDK